MLPPVASMGMVHALRLPGLATILKDGHPCAEAEGAGSFGHLTNIAIAHTRDDTSEPAHHSKWKAGRVSHNRMSLIFLSPKWPAVYMISRVWSFIVRWSRGHPCGITSWAIVSISMSSSMLVLLMTSVGN